VEDTVSASVKLMKQVSTNVSHMESIVSHGAAAYAEAVVALAVKDSAGRDEKKLLQAASTLLQFSKWGLHAMSMNSMPEFCKRRPF